MDAAGGARRSGESRLGQMLADGLNPPVATVVGNRQPQGKREKPISPQGTRWKAEVLGMCRR